MSRPSRWVTTLLATPKPRGANGRSDKREGPGRGGDSTAATPSCRDALGVKPYPGPLPLEGSVRQPPRQAFTYSPPPSTNHSRFDEANQIQTEETPSQITTFTFDANGNTQVENAGGSLTTYTWNVDNMCVGIALPNAALNTFAYDADLKRRQAQDSSGLAKFINDLDNVLAETDSGGTTQVAYTLEPQTYGSLVSQRRSGATAWHLFDALGSTERLTGSDQAALATYLNTAFGVPKVATGDHPNRLRWVGRLGYRWEPDARQYDVRRRRLDPTRGRWDRVDPRQERQDWYAYGDNSPCTATDPSGSGCVTIWDSRWFQPTPTPIVGEQVGFRKRVWGKEFKSDVIFEIPGVPATSIGDCYDRVGLEYETHVLYEYAVEEACTSGLRVRVRRRYGPRVGQANLPIRYFYHQRALLGNHKLWTKTKEITQFWFYVFLIAHGIQDYFTRFGVKILQ
jgi:RHS repeat-associated protein